MKTTAEQAAEKKKERDEKAAKFKSLTKKIFEKVIQVFAGSFLCTCDTNCKWLKYTQF